MIRREERAPAHAGCAHFMGGMSAHGDGLPRPGSSALPPYEGGTPLEPFSFERRNKEKPKSIMQVTRVNANKR